VEHTRRDFIRQVGAGAFVAATATAADARQAAPATGRVLGANDRINVGFVGCGGRMRAHIDRIVRRAKENGDVQAVAVNDIWDKRKQMARERTGVDEKAVYHDYRELCARPDIDVVVIASPDHWHFEHAMTALRNGKDVYLEKPMTYTVDEARKIAETVKASGRVLQVGSQYCSLDHFWKTKKAIDDGLIGQVVWASGGFGRNSTARGGEWNYKIDPDATEQTLDWKAFLGSAPSRPFDPARFFRWRCYWDYGGGIAGDLFVHLITTIHYVMGATMPETVLASGQLYRWKESREVPDTLNAILTYPEGFTVNLSSTFNNESASESGFEILGTEGSVAFRGDRLVFTPENVHENNRWVVSSWPQALEEAYYADPKVQASESPGTWPNTITAGSAVWDETGKDATVVHMGNFLASVRSRQQPAENATVGHHAAAAAHMVNLSVRQKRAMRWDFTAGTVQQS